MPYFCIRYRIFVQIKTELTFEDTIFMPPLIDKNIKLRNLAKAIPNDTPVALIRVHINYYFAASVRLSNNPQSSLDRP